MAKMTKKAAVAHVVDVVHVQHKVSQHRMRDQLQALGFSYGEAGDIISATLKRKLLRSSGIDLRPLEVSKVPHLERDDMTGWYGLYIDGKYTGQRENEVDARNVLQQLTAKSVEPEKDQIRAIIKKLEPLLK